MAIETPTPDAHASEPPAPTISANRELMTALLDVERGLYAIQVMTARSFGDGTTADMARLGIEYVAEQAERGLRAILNPLADQVGAAS